MSDAAQGGGGRGERSSGRVPEVADTAASGVEALAVELDAAAQRLRDGELEQAQAAALVERLAEAASRLGAALEREARATPAGETPGQETLL